MEDGDMVEEEEPPKAAAKRAAKQAAKEVQRLLANVKPKGLLCN